MSPPLTLIEIRNFMVINGGKVTNHDLVKYFKESLTHPDTQSKFTIKFSALKNSKIANKCQ